MKKKKYYTIYKINKESKDIEYIEELESAEEVQKEYDLKNKKSIYNYLVKDIDKIDVFNLKNLMKNNYFIMIDTDIIEEVWKNFFFFCKKVINKIF